MCENSNREPHKSRDLFGVQLEVTSLLLDTEIKKLSTLQHELQSTQNIIVEDQAEDQQLELICAISRIEAQVEQLEREYKAQFALGAYKLMRNKDKGNRSQPAMGLKHLPKLRPSIFGTVAKDADSSSEDNNMQSWDNANSLSEKSLKNTNSSSSLLIIAENKTADSESGSSVDLDEKDNSADKNLRLRHRSGKHCIDSLVFEDMNLVSGTLDALTQHLVPTEDYYPDRAYIFAYLLCSRLHLPPHQLLGRVFKLAMSGTKTRSFPRLVRQDSKLVNNIVQLLGEWGELFPYDFRDERMMAHVKTISQKCISIDPPIRKEVSLLLTSLLGRLTALEKYEDFVLRITKEAVLSDPPSCSPSILSICPNPVSLAQQLTHIELERLSHIGPEEFVQTFAKDNSIMDAKYKDMKKTHNLEFYVQWFNRLSYYVATEICKVSKKKSRVRVIEFWIEVARESFNIGNFNSLMAIIAGLNMSPVSRLKKTWSKVNTQQLSFLEKHMDCTANFSSYRSILRDAVWRFSSTPSNRDSDKIVIPFFSLLVKDLFFLNEGCASKIPSNGHINFEKFWQFAKQVTEVMAWQQVTCSYPTMKSVLHSLHTAPIFSERDLCTASYECEGVDSVQEKQRLEYLQRDNNKCEKIIESTPEHSPSYSPRGSVGSNESMKISL